MNLEEQKAAFRKRALRQSPPAPGLRPAMDAAVVRAVKACPEYGTADAVALFAPIGCEPDIFPLLYDALAAGKSACFPRCNTQGTALAFYSVQDDASFVRGAYGILEPDPRRARLVDARNIQFMLVPGVAFAPAGTRLGRGKGYSDRALACSGAVRCGVAYAQYVYPSLPAGPQDARMDLVITERGVAYRAEKS